MYEKLSFQKIGVAPKGYRMKDGSYRGLWLFYKGTTD